MKCSYGGGKTDATFYVADVRAPAICGLPTSCQLHLFELHCEIHAGSHRKSFPAIKSKRDLQLLYPDRFEGIGKFEGEYHIFQQRMDFILENCPGTVGIADNMAVHGFTEEEHDVNLHNVILVAPQHGLVFNLDKCMIKD